MSMLNFQTIDPVVGDPLVTYQPDPFDDPLPAAIPTNIHPGVIVTVKYPDGTTEALSVTEASTGRYEATALTLVKGRGRYVLRWDFRGSYAAAIEYIVFVKESRVLAS